MSISSFEFHAPEFNTPIHAPRTASRTRGPAAFARALRRAFAWIGHQRQVRRDTNSLMQLDDRALADIGVSRMEVLHLARYGRLRRHAGEFQAR